MKTNNTELIEKFNDVDFILKEFIEFVYELSDGYAYNWYRCGVKDDMIFEAIHNSVTTSKTSKIPNYRRLDLSRGNVLAYWRTMIENSFRKIINQHWEYYHFKKDFYTINFETSYLEMNDFSCNN